MSEDKLPKQWKDWLKSGNFTTYRGRGSLFLYNFKGRGRHWRVNCCGELQCSVEYDSFDRWANSVWICTQGIPHTKKEFLNRVEYMLKRATRKDRLAERFKGEV